MRFASHLGALLAFLLSAAVAQEPSVDFEDEEIGIPEEIDTEGLFDDELEPIDDDEIVRPKPRPATPTQRPPRQKFPKAEHIRRKTQNLILALVARPLFLFNLATHRGVLVMKRMFKSGQHSPRMPILVRTNLKKHSHKRGV